MAFSIDGALKSREQLQSERDWLRVRVRSLGSWSSSEPALGGRADNAMVDCALSGDWPGPECLPRSERDLEACLNTLASAPEHLRGRMEAVVRHYRKETGLEAAPSERQEAVPISDFIAMLERGELVATQEDLLAAGPPPVYGDDELEAEWHWLRRRARLVGVLFAEDEQVPRRWGNSSNALVDHLLGGPKPRPDQHPLDFSDLHACEQAISDAPPHLRERGEAVLEDYRALVEARQTGSRPRLSDDYGFDFPEAPDLGEAGPER